MPSILSCRVLWAAILLATAAAAASAQTEPLAASAAAAAPTKTYAIVSLIGDEFAVVTRRPLVGTQADPNLKKTVPISDPVFDRVAATAAEQAILSASPGMPVVKVGIRDPRLFALQDRLLTESGDSHDMRVALHDLLAKAGATDLLLIIKRRADALFPVVSGTVSGGGKIGGLGFFIDEVTLMFDTKHLQTGEGFLAPYAYIMVSLMDIGTMNVVRSKAVQQSSMALTVEKVNAVLAWDALTAAEKVEALDGVIKTAVTSGTKSAIAP